MWLEVKDMEAMEAEAQMVVTGTSGQGASSAGTSVRCPAGDWTWPGHPELFRCFVDGQTQFAFDGQPLSTELAYCIYLCESIMHTCV